MSELKDLYRSTSIHHLNADKRLNIIQKFFYLILNWANNLFPYSNVDKDIVIRDFVSEDLRAHWSKLRIKSSPSRKLSELFLLELPWNQIRQELNEIHVLDIGCGPGNSGSKLIEFSNNNVASYTGFDIRKHDNWTKLEEMHPNFRFQQRISSNILEYIPEGTNFFITQSSIEHFDEDLCFFDQIREYIQSCRRSVIQVHLFHSSPCLKLFLFHGVRQYTPRTVSKIWKLFKGFSYAQLFRLGGRECNHLHYKYITEPIVLKGVDLRDLRTQEYDRKLLKTIEQDMKRPQKLPAFYALIIHSNQINKLF